MTEEDSKAVYEDCVEQLCYSPEDYSKTGDKHEQKQQPPQYLQSKHLLKAKSGRNRHAGLNNAIKLDLRETSPSCSPSECIIILEEGKELPVFWNGKVMVALMKWGPFPESRPPSYSTVGEFLSAHVAGKYIKKCTMSLQVSNTKYITDLRVSDGFSRILDHQLQAKKAATLLLTYSNEETPESCYSKYTLNIREANKRKVFFSEGNVTDKLIARLNQGDTSLTVGSCLQNYVAKGYLTEGCSVDLVRECYTGLVNTEEKIRSISLSDPIQTLFLGNSASIVLTNSAIENYDNDNSPELGMGFGYEEIPVFINSRCSSHWKGLPWSEIHDEVGVLLSSVEMTMRERILTTEVYANLEEAKTALEAVLRKEKRIVDEVWRCFLTLQQAHALVLSSNRTVSDSPERSSSLPFETPQVSSVSVFPTPRLEMTRRTGLDGDAPLQFIPQQQQELTCAEFISSTFVRCALELELFDEGTRGMNRAVGVGIGIAVVVIICGVVYYY